MQRKLFCEISPLTFKISRIKEIQKRNIQDVFSRKKFAKEKNMTIYPVLIYRHDSLIRRKLNNVDLHLQDNKAKNLAIATPKVNGIIIRPGEVFSFWKLVGPIEAKRGYLDGVTIVKGNPEAGIGGGMCQFTNLLHWMVLHTGLDIIEHHHHNGVDLFPDFGRKVPFGTGTSIMYNTLDYQFKNNTDSTFQIFVYTTDEYLCGEIRADKEQQYNYHIVEEESYFEEIDDVWYRNNKVYRKCIDKKTGNIIKNELLIQNHAKIFYDPKFIKPELIKNNKNKIEMTINTDELKSNK